MTPTEHWGRSNAEQGLTITTGGQIALLGTADACQRHIALLACMRMYTTAYTPGQTWREGSTQLVAHR